MTFKQFTKKLNECGWNNKLDAQNTEIRKLWDEIFNAETEIEEVTIAVPEGVSQFIVGDNGVTSMKHSHKQVSSGYIKNIIEVYNHNVIVAEISETAPIIIKYKKG